VRFGLTILPERPWAEAERQWRTAEELGFDHAWTYDHLVWAGLPDSPWFGTTPTLTAAALATHRIGLGTLVSSPNYRHPAALHRDVQSLDDISGGRFLLGVGNGGDLDSQVLGQPALTTKERVDRFQEFTRLYLRLRDWAPGEAGGAHGVAGGAHGVAGEAHGEAGEDLVTSEGTWFTLRGMRPMPPVAHVPVLAAANGPRSVRFAAREADGWITNGARVQSLDEWFEGLAQSTRTLEEALAAAGRDPAAYPRYLNLDSSPVFSLSSPDVFEDLVTRAAALRFTDVVSHWPRPTPPYEGVESTLSAVANEVIPRLRESLGGTMTACLPAAASTSPPVTLPSASASPRGPS